MGVLMLWDCYRLGCLFGVCILLMLVFSWVRCIVFSVTCWLLDFGFGLVR